MAITLGLVEAVDGNGVYVSMPGTRGVLRGPYLTLQDVAVGDRVLTVTTDDGETVIVGLASAAAPRSTPATSTDNTVPRFDGTGGALQNSGVTIDDSGFITGGRLHINSAGGGESTVFLQSGGTNRWKIYKDASVEGGGNGGSHLVIEKRTDAGGGNGAVVTLLRDSGRVRLHSVGSTAGLEFGASGPVIMASTGTPSGVIAPVGSTWRQTDANSTYGNLTGLLWNKVGTGTTLGTDWLVDFEGRWIDYTPSNSNITIGTTGNANTGTYTLSGKTCHGRLYLKLGTSGSFTGTANFGLPQTAATYSNPVYAGSVYFEDGGVAGYYGWVSIASGATRFTIPYAGASSTINSVVGASTPFAWGAGDFLSAAFTYQIA